MNFSTAKQNRKNIVKYQKECTYKYEVYEAFISNILQKFEKQYRDNAS